MRFTITWRDGAYYVSEPNVGTRDVVDVADMEAAVAAEREACAEIAELEGEAHDVDTGRWKVANAIAEAIRNRT